MNEFIKDGVPYITAVILHIVNILRNKIVIIFYISRNEINVILILWIHGITHNNHVQKRWYLPFGTIKISLNYAFYDNLW